MLILLSNMYDFLLYNAEILHITLLLFSHKFIHSSIVTLYKITLNFWLIRTVGIKKAGLYACLSSQLVIFHQPAQNIRAILTFLLPDTAPLPQYEACFPYVSRGNAVPLPALFLSHSSRYIPDQPVFLSCRPRDLLFPLN